MKKLFSIGISLLLMLTLLVSALGVAAANPTVSLPDLTGKPGDTITVPIRFKDNPGLISAKVKVGYDATALEFLGSDEGAFPSSGYSTGDPKKNPYVVNFCDGVANSDYTAEDFATLRFRIKADAKPGSYPLTLSCDLEGDFFNHEWETVYFAMDEGLVTIIGGAGTHATVQGNATNKTSGGKTTGGKTASSAATPSTSAAQGGNGTTATDGVTKPTDGNTTTATDTVVDGETGPSFSAHPEDGATQPTNPTTEVKKKKPLTPGLVAIPIAAVMIIAVTIHLVTILRRKKDDEE